MKKLIVNITLPKRCSKTVSKSIRKSLKRIETVGRKSVGMMYKGKLHLGIERR